MFDSRRLDEFLVKKKSRAALRENRPASNRGTVSATAKSRISGASGAMTVIGRLSDAIDEN
jgi:hypothetical protein